jgi:hypothetical protein
VGRLFYFVSVYTKGGENMNKNAMQKTQSASGIVKATQQEMGKAGKGGDLEKGKDLRQNASGGAKAKGSI